jgi:predicted permease
MKWWQLKKRNADLERELRADLDLEEEEQREAGLSQDEARDAARRALGNTTLIREQVQEAWGWATLECLAQDIRFSLRQMRRSPIFTATVVGTLALGIGSAAAMFTVVDHLMLRPVPYPDPQRLVVLHECDKKGTAAWFAPWLDIEQWLSQSHSFEQIAFSTSTGGRTFLEGGTASTEIDDEQVSSNLFDTLGVQPALGRGFVPETLSFAAGKNAGTIVLSDAIWREEFGADKEILGKQVKINDGSYTVVGVLPAGFRYPENGQLVGQVWTPIELNENDKGRDYKAMRFRVLGRLRKGATVRSASAEMSLVQDRLAEQYYEDPQWRQDHSTIRIQPYGESLVGSDVSKALLALFAASGVLWLIANLNVINLILARSSSRQREFAMRGALGASRWRVVQQVLFEGLTLSGAAAVLGIGFAAGSIKLLTHELSQHLPLPVSSVPDLRVLVTLLVLTCISALMSSAWPAIVAAKAPIEAALKQGGNQSGIGRQQHRLSKALVTMEVAMSLVLLMACGLLLRTIYSLRHVSLGYRTDHIIVASLNIPSFRFAAQNMTVALYQPLVQRVQQMHGVQGAGLMSEVPLSNTAPMHLGLRIDGNVIYSYFKAVSPGIQNVFGFKMAAGRFFNADDTPSSEPVIVVNQAFARIHSPDKNNPLAILRTRSINLRKNVPTRIVGILEDERQANIKEPSQPEIDICIPQITPDDKFYERMEDVAMDLAVRTEQPPAEVIPELRSILRQASPEFQNAPITTMDRIVEDSYGSERLAAHLLEIFGGAALILCVAGLYGLLAYIVTQRTRELGVRIALGAQRANLLWLVMRQAGLMLLLGLAAGVGFSFAAGKLARSFLFGVKADDGLILAGTSALLFASGLIAAYIPASHAASVDPMQALRSE